MPYVKKIGQNTEDSHQTSPAYMLTFIRWSNRDTFNYDLDNLAVRKPLVVINDCINVVTSNRKTGITAAMTGLLKGGDINYRTAISAGDFVFLNMVNDRTKIWKGVDGDNTLRNRALGLMPINRYNDGFKGLFKVQSVRKEMIIDPQTGTKVLAYRVHAFSFTEFNTKIYYDPQVYNELNGKYRLFAAQFDSFWSNTVSGKNNFSIQRIMKLLTKVLIGQGVRKNDTSLPPPPNRHFRIPPSVGKLLGIKNARYASDIYNYIFGVWSAAPSNASNPGIGFNPNLKKESQRGFYNTGKELDGRKIFAAEYWNNVKIWSILQSYLNGVINEMYTTCRISPDNTVMPTLVVRQKAFTSNHFIQGKDLGKGRSKTKITRKNISRHLEMPRWKIAPEIITHLDTGADEAARINYVQIYTRTLASNEARNRALQAGQGNFVTDIGDIERNGLHPYIATANFDFPAGNPGENRNKGKEWAVLVADWLIGGHLRDSGVIECIGIEEPISVGDKLEFNNIVYEIEEVSDSMSIDKSGRKRFRTLLRVSFGMDIRSDSNRPVYPEMEHTDAWTAQKEDFNSEGGEAILPGISDTQDVGGRVLGEEVKETAQSSFTLNPKKRTGNNGTSKKRNKIISKTKSDGNKAKKD